MKVVVTGASGTVGRALLPSLAAAGHQVVQLVRRAPQARSEAQWQPTGAADPKLVEGTDAVVHLAGETIAAGRWSPAKKAAIRDSRVLGTRTIASSIAAASSPPQVLISASAVGYYGNRGDEVLTEQSAPGSGFLAEVCRLWEAEGQAAARTGTRIAVLRIGIILSRQGGALPKMLPPFRLGLGGRMGTGRQWWSWIAIDDLVDVILYALSEPLVEGAVNAVAPNAVRNASFTRVLGEVLHRPTIFPLPAFVVRLAFGEMGEEMLLASQRVQPVAALSAGFRFRYPKLKGALEHLRQR